MRCKAHVGAKTAKSRNGIRCRAALNDAAVTGKSVFVLELFKTDNFMCRLADRTCTVCGTGGSVCRNTANRKGKCCDSLTEKARPSGIMPLQIQKGNCPLRTFHNITNGFATRASASALFIGLQNEFHGSASESDRRKRLHRAKCRNHASLAIDDTGTVDIGIIAANGRCTEQSDRMHRIKMPGKNKRRGVHFGIESQRHNVACHRLRITFHTAADFFSKRSKIGACFVYTCLKVSRTFNGAKPFPNIKIFRI